MLQTIRPNKILKLLKLKKLNNNLSLKIPDGEIGSTTILEKVMLVAFSRLIKSKTIFEFGTYKGETTELFLINNLCKNLISIDLPILVKQKKLSNLNLLNDLQNDKFLSINRSNATDKKLKSLSKKNLIKLNLIKIDSRIFKPKNLVNNVDFIFIDGGHSYQIIDNDTQIAFKLLRNRGDGIIFWHDYDLKIHSKVTLYLNKLSLKKKLFRIGDTSLVFFTKKQFIKLINKK